MINLRLKNRRARFPLSYFGFPLSYCVSEFSVAFPRLTSESAPESLGFVSVIISAGDAKVLFENFSSANFSFTENQ